MPPPRLTMEEALARSAAHNLPIQSVIDVGASNGQWSKLAMKFFPHAHYLLMEPLEEQRANLETFKSTRPNVHLAFAAASDADGSVPFHVSPDLDGSLVTADPHIGVERHVRAAKIDSEITRLQLPGPFAIKLDTHGYEVPILNGALQTLKNTNLLIIEVYNFKITETCLRFHQIITHAETLGFRCFDLADIMLRERDHALWQMDLLFAPANSKIFQSDSYR